MHPILSAGILIGALCAVWTFVMGFTGWYRDPTMAAVFFLVIPIEIGGLIWGLKRTAAEERTYRAQVVAGTLMSVVAGVIIIASSLLFTTVFPDHLQELEARGSSATPMGQALDGFIGTLVTGILASAVIAIWVRDTRRKVPRADPSIR
jgi:hypothetical protein